MIFEAEHPRDSCGWSFTNEYIYEKRKHFKKEATKKKGKENKQTKTQLRPFPSSPPHIVIPATLSAIGPEEEKRRGYIPGTVKNSSLEYYTFVWRGNVFFFHIPTGLSILSGFKDRKRCIAQEICIKTPNSVGKVLNDFHHRIQQSQFKRNTRPSLNVYDRNSNLGKSTAYCQPSLSVMLGFVSTVHCSSAHCHWLDGSTYPSLVRSYTPLSSLQFHRSLGRRLPSKCRAIKPNESNATLQRVST